MRGRGIKCPLGRYTICSKKLQDDIIQIRSARGGAVKLFPSERVSAKVGAALRKIVEGGGVSFDDIEGLSDEERRYLHRVATHCDINDKLKIPAPKKDLEAIQADRFTLLRGEIAAGNDSPELVKEFKTMILQMSNTGRLPRGQVHEILLDLLALGK